LALPRRQWHQLDGLRQTDLQSVFWYHDAQTDDALLTAAVMRSAQALGRVVATGALRRRNAAG
jgi:glycerol-3-phosphate dehydrogenase